MPAQQILLGLGAKDYEIERSLRFNDDDSAYLNKTFGSAGNRKTFTISAWIKLGNLGTVNPIFSRYTANNEAGFLGLYVNSNDYLYFTGWSTVYFQTNRLFRDPSAWYHIVFAMDTTQSTNTDRWKLYINGTQETSFASTSYPSQNADLAINEAVEHMVGKYSTNQFDGYIAELNFIDGSALTSSSFGKTNSETGQWVPKKYSGSYGTNGFYLNFSDNSNTTAATLGKDSSGNGHNFTPNNLVTGDSVKDSPTNNFATLRTHSTPEASGVAVAEGNLKYTTGSTGGAGTLNRIAISTILPTSGKWYAEVIPTSGSGNQCAGIVPYTVEETPTTDRPRYNIVNFNTGQILKNLSGSHATDTYGASISTNDVLCIYMDMDAKTVYYGKNGQWADGSGNWDQSTPTSGSALGNSFFNHKTGGHEGFGIAIMSVTGGASITCIANFGQDSTFAGTLSAGGNADANGVGDFKHTVPANALALCSANLLEPTIAFPNKHFGTLLWTGNATVRTISDTSAVNFTPDMVWVKCRSASHDHQLTDSVRGTSKALPVNTNGQEVDWDTEYSGNNKGMGDYTNGGFGLDDNGNNARYNANSETYVAWNWKGGGSASSNTNGNITSSVSANTTAGFSIVTYTGTGSQNTVGHGLGVKPKVIITKLRDTNTQDWMFYPKQLTGTGATYIKFNEGNAVASDAHTYPNVEPTTTVYTVGGDDGGDGTNGNGKAYVAYCFSEVAGYSKFGSYTGNGSTDGTFVYTGFRPAWLLMKNTGSGSTDWILKDTKIETFNVMDAALKANTNDTEASSLSSVDFLSNGFKIRNTGSFTNGSGSSYIYMAFAEAPFKYSRAR